MKAPTLKVMNESLYRGQWFCISSTVRTGNKQSCED